jgi:hypothetical protein
LKCDPLHFLEPLRRRKRRRSSGSNICGRKPQCILNAADWVSSASSSSRCRGSASTRCCFGYRAPLRYLSTFFLLLSDVHISN